MDCEIIVQEGQNYKGHIKAKTTFPSKDSINGTLCKLSFHTSTGKRNIISQRSWRNVCTPVTYMHWTEWGSWSNCTELCGNKKRFRQCIGYY